MVVERVSRGFAEFTQNPQHGPDTLCAASASAGLAVVLAMASVVACVTVAQGWKELAQS